MNTYRTRALLLASFLFVACDGGGGSSDADPDTASGTARAPLVNGFVFTDVVERDRDGTVVFRAAQRLDVAGNRILEEGEDLGNGRVFTSELRYDNAGNLVRSELTSTLDGTVTDRTFEFEHDTRGLLQSLVLTTDENALTFVETERFRYDEEDRLVEREARAGLGEDGDLLVRRTYAYDADDLPVSGLERIFGSDGEDRVERQSYTHDAARRLTGLSIDTDDDGTTDGTVLYEYDVAGNMIRRTRSGADGAVTLTADYTYEAVDEAVYNLWLRIFRYLFL